MEIQVGDYIRTIDGIKRIVKINTGDRKTIFGQYRLDKPYKGSYSIAEKNILKHSKNIIDLIEVGDYVNGYEVKDIDTTYRIGNGGKEEKYLYMEVTEPIYNNFIVTVLTKEMFESVEYRVGE